MKYKINRNRPPLTEGEFTSTRDFNKVLKGYRALKIPFYRSGKFLTGGSAIVVAVAVGLIMLFGDVQDNTTENSFITAPIAQVAMPSDTFIVDADSASEIDYKTGSKLHIPIHAFKDAGGNLIKGKVEIRYREFHDQKDIFLSGIPMTYDSAGAKYIFESAGMMEITAYQDGKPLLTNPEKPIRVDMVSNTAEDRYNTYYLDTDAKKWINLNQANLIQQDVWKRIESDSVYSESVGDSVVAEPRPALIKCEQELKKAVAAVQAVEKQKPVPVVKSDKTKSMFHIVVNEEDFPEIAMYKGVHFQVKDEKTFNPSSARTEWEDVKLKKLSGLDYEVTFTKGAQVLKVVAAPVVDDKDLAAAQKVYDTKYAAYNTKLAEKKAAEVKAREALAEQRKLDERNQKEMVAIYEAQNKEWQDMQKKNGGQQVAFQDIEVMEMKQQEMMSKIGRAGAKEDLSSAKASVEKTALVFRTFVVAKFGVHNADHPNSWPSDANVVADFSTESGEKLNLKCVYLVARGYNIVYPYYASNGECSNFKFDSSKDNMLWATTSDNKLAVVDIKSFKAQQAKTGKVHFKFKMIDKEIKSTEEAKQYLEI